MQLILNIENESVAKKILSLLEHFKKDGLEINQKINPDSKFQINKLTDDYIQKNWRTIISDALKDFDDDYYKSIQYKMDRGEYLMEKDK